MNEIDTLKNKEDFDKLYGRSRSAASRCVVILYRKNGLSVSREAFIASKKVGNSVQRNRARRLMKEAFRTSDMPVPGGYDIAFIARNTIADAKCADVQRSIETALTRAGIAGRP
ncbi:MAG: ribonuclease P protein component [Firmicutes bacterium]|nr:ribonuclease P protein component [Bacillota bacterium]